MTPSTILGTTVSSQQIRRDSPTTSSRRASRELLILCITSRLSSGDARRISQILAQPVDWQYLLHLAAFHGVVPLVAHCLTTNDLLSQVPELYQKQLKKEYNTNVYRNVILADELTKTLSTLSRNGIEVITLKGTALAEALYGNPALRTVVDMDILVHPEDINSAENVLTDCGYRKMTVEKLLAHPFHGEPYYKGGRFPLFLELHWALEDPAVVPFPKEEIWHRARQLKLQGVSTNVLSPEINLLFLANHLTKNDTQLLKSLGDINELLKKYEGSIDWDYITQSAHSWQMAPAAYYTLVMAKELMGAPVTKATLAILRPEKWRRWLLNILASKDTFVVPIKWRRLREERVALARSLMVTGRHRMLAALARQRDPEKKHSWLRMSFWIIPVLAASLWHHLTVLVFLAPHHTASRQQ